MVTVGFTIAAVDVVDLDFVDNRDHPFLQPHHFEFVTFHIGLQFRHPSMQMDVLVLTILFLILLKDSRRVCKILPLTVATTTTSDITVLMAVRRTSNCCRIERILRFVALLVVDGGVIDDFVIFIFGIVLTVVFATTGHFSTRLTELGQSLEQHDGLVSGSNLL